MVSFGFACNISSEFPEKAETLRCQKCSNTSPSGPGSTLEAPDFCCPRLDLLWHVPTAVWWEKLSLPALLCLLSPWISDGSPEMLGVLGACVIHTRRFGLLSLLWFRVVPDFTLALQCMEHSAGMLIVQAQLPLCFARVWIHTFHTSEEPDT